MTDEPIENPTIQHAVPSDLIELYEVIEWQKAVAAQNPVTE